MRDLVAIFVYTLRGDAVVKELIANIIIEFQLLRREIKLIMLKMLSADLDSLLIVKIWLGMFMSLYIYRFLKSRHLHKRYQSHLCYCV